MNDDDREFLVDAMKTLIGVGFVALLVVTAGFAIWEFVA